MRLFDLVRGVANAQYIQDVELEVSGIAYHSARVEEGDLFVAVPGYATDGHDYIPEALERGARALMVMDPGKLPDDLPTGVAAVRVRDARAALARVADLWHHHPSGRLKLVGITGTNGKTTTAFLVDSICRAAGMATGLVGTVTYRIADEELPVARTTPEAPDLQKMFSRMVDEGVEMAAMEVSSTPWNCTGWTVASSRPPSSPTSPRTISTGTRTWSSTTWRSGSSSAPRRRTPSSCTGPP